MNNTEFERASQLCAGMITTVLVDLTAAGALSLGDCAALASKLRGLSQAAGAEEAAAQFAELILKVAEVQQQRGQPL